MQLSIIFVVYWPFRVIALNASISFISLSRSGKILVSALNSTGCALHEPAGCFLLAYSLVASVIAITVKFLSIYYWQFFTLLSLDNLDSLDFFKVLICFNCFNNPLRSRIFILINYIHQYFFLPWVMVLAYKTLGLMSQTFVSSSFKSFMCLGFTFEPITTQSL